MPFDGTSKASVAAQSMIVLGMMEPFFDGGARWARRTYCAADGKRCLLGAIDHARCETGLTDDRAAEYLAGAINLRQLSKGLPLLGDTANCDGHWVQRCIRAQLLPMSSMSLNAPKELAAIDCR